MWKNLFQTWWSCSSVTIFLCHQNQWPINSAETWNIYTLFYIKAFYLFKIIKLKFKTIHFFRFKCKNKCFLICFQTFRPHCIYLPCVPVLYIPNTFLQESFPLSMVDSQRSMQVRLGVSDFSCRTEQSWTEQYSTTGEHAGCVIWHRERRDSG